MCATTAITPSNSGTEDWIYIRYLNTNFTLNYNRPPGGLYSPDPWIGIQQFCFPYDTKTSNCYEVNELYVLNLNHRLIGFTVYAGYTIWREFVDQWLPCDPSAADPTPWSVEYIIYHIHH